LIVRERLVELYKRELNDAVPELTSLISLLPDMNTSIGIIKKPVELDNFVNTVRKTLN
jgi:hypothetical protein